MMEKYNINQTPLKILGLYTGDFKKSLHLSHDGLLNTGRKSNITHLHAKIGFVESGTLGVFLGTYRINKAKLNPRARYG